MSSRSGTSQLPATALGAPAPPKKRRWRYLALALFVIVALLVTARLALPSYVLWYVNRTIDLDPIYDGEVEEVEIHLWRGAYSIHGVRLNKVTGNVPVPLFAAPRVDLAVQWDALLHGDLVGRVRFDQPELHFVDAGDPSESQTGAGGPWLSIIRDLFPFKINRAEVRDGTIHFHAFHKDPPVDLFLSEVWGTIDNLTNLDEETAPLIATVHAEALAMNHARVQYAMKLDPSSYRPTFDLAVKLIGLDVTKTNDLARAYGAFDFEHGWLDLVVELKGTEGRLEGYVKPMFRDLKVLSLRKDIAEDNVLELFWEAVVGLVAEALKNRPRDQFATKIPLHGDVSAPQRSILEIIGNVLRNAFIRAYLPRLEGPTPAIEGLEFGPGELLDPETDFIPGTPPGPTRRPS